MSPQICYGCFHDHHALKELPIQKENTTSLSMRNETKQKKNIEVGKPEPETRYLEMIDKIKEKTATSNNAAAQAENVEMKAHAKKEKAAAARAKSENVEARQTSRKNMQRNHNE